MGNKDNKLSEILPTLLTSSALASRASILEAAGNGSVQHGDTFWNLLTEATPSATLTTKTLPYKPNTRG